MTRDERYITAALEQAEEAASLGEVPVGAVVVKENDIIARGHNRRETDKNALSHAETEAIRSACELLGDWRLDGCELFVTLEPCAMCAGAILQSRIKRVVFGAFDPAAGCMGSVIDMTLLPIGAPTELLGGVLQRECEDLLKRFFEERRGDKNV